MPSVAVAAAELGLSSGCSGKPIALIKAGTAIELHAGDSRSTMRKITSNKPTARFWTVLGGINIFAVLCVIGTFLHVDSSDGRLVAGFTLIAVALLLLITDVVSIVLVYGD
jgi:hypothetical protein